MKHNRKVSKDLRKIKETLESGLDRLIVSFDGATKKTYESIRKGAKFEIVIDNVKNLIKERNAKGLKKPFVEMQMVVTSSNIRETKLFENLSKKIGVNSACLKTLMVFQNTRNKDYMKKVEKLFVTNKIARYKREKNGRLILKNSKGCPELQNCVITSDGDVVICCFDLHGKYSFGNAIKESLKDIWNSSNYREFRSKVMNNRKLPICKFCNTTEHIGKSLLR